MDPGVPRASAAAHANMKPCVAFKLLTQACPSSSEPFNLSSSAVKGRVCFSHLDEPAPSSERKSRPAAYSATPLTIRDDYKPERQNHGIRLHLLARLLHQHPLDIPSASDPKPTHQHPTITNPKTIHRRQPLRNHPGNTHYNPSLHTLSPTPTCNR